MIQQLAAPDVKTQFFRLAGGLDQVSAATLIKPGFVFDSQNYEIDSVKGGYRRIYGYERFDGRTSPSSANYWLIGVNITGTVAVGNTITGATSGATGKVLQINTGQLVLGRVVGTFNAAENFTIAAVVQGATTSLAVRSGASTVADDTAYIVLAVADLRADILAVPGSGRIRGVWLYKDIVYAFRDNAGGTACDMWKESTSGWVQVTFLYEVTFSAGGTAQPADGQVLTQGGVTATIRRVVQRTGAWSGTAAGTMVISAPAGGDFAAGAATVSTSGATLTLAGIQTAITRPPGGRYEFVNTNFTGSQDTLRMYGVDGVGSAFEFDGTYFVPIHTNMTVDVPSHITEHKNHLFVSFFGSVQHSSIGNPYGWSVITGSDEIGVSDHIVGMKPQPGDAGGGVLSVFTLRTASNLYGSSVADWQLVLGSPDAGASPYTVQFIGSMFALSQRGIQQIDASQAYGDFQYAAISGVIQTLINRLQGLAIESAVLKERNQYRLFFSDNTAISMTVMGNKLAGFMVLNYGKPVRCYTSGNRSDGREYSYFGSDDGYVYRDNIGTSFDGSAIESWLRLPFNHFNSPEYRKAFKHAVLDVVSDGPATLRVTYEMGGGEVSADPGTAGDISISGQGGYWDEFNWDEFTWDAPTVGRVDVGLSGTETSISLMFYNNSSTDSSYSIQGVNFHYILRRLRRG